jgi:acyl-coenzyme A thioesterase PaaI-like protein
MKKIANPYAGIEGYNCFGCSPSNPIGLRLEFFLEGEELIASWDPKKDYVGFETVLHGGIQALAHDEIASWVVFAICGTAGFTQSLDVRYKSTVRIEKGTISLRARLERMDGPVAVIATSLFDGAGELGSEGTARYFTVPEKIARRRFHYPGKEAFVGPS